MLYEVQTTEVKSMPTGPNRSATAGCSAHWPATDYLRVSTSSSLLWIAHICTALLVLGLIMPTSARVAQLGAHRNNVLSPVACSARNVARVSVPLSGNQEQSSESFRRASVSAAGVNITAASLLQITSDTPFSLRARTQLSSLRRPRGICNQDRLAPSPAFSHSA